MNRFISSRESDDLQDKLSCKPGSEQMSTRKTKGNEYWKGFKPLVHALVGSELVVIFQEDNLGVVMDSSMKRSAQCAVKKADKILGCIKDRTAWKSIAA